MVQASDALKSTTRQFNGLLTTRQRKLVIDILNTVVYYVLVTILQPWETLAHYGSPKAW
jgi:hypothetical protein